MIEYRFGDIPRMNSKSEDLARLSASPLVTCPKSGDAVAVNGNCFEVSVQKYETASGEHKNLTVYPKCPHAVGVEAGWSPTDFQTLFCDYKPSFFKTAWNYATNVLGL